MNPIIQDYKHTYLFYLLATLLPWSFWAVAAYVSHSTDYAYAGETASLLAFAGLLAPTGVALFLIRRNPRLTRDLLQRMVNLRGGRPVYWALTLMIMRYLFGQ